MSTRGLVLDTACPVNWDWPGNRGLRLWLAGWPNSGWSGGLTMRDAVGLSGKKGGNGTLTNGPTWVAGQRGAWALSFDGIDDEVVMPGRVSTAVDNFAMECVFRAGATDAEFRCVAYNGDDSGGWGVFQGVSSAAGNIGGLYGGVAWVDGGYSYTPGELLHVILTRRSGTTTVYVNGRQPGSTSASVPISPTNFFGVGHEPGHASRWFDEIVYSVVVADRGWTMAEAAASYAQFRRGYPDALRWMRPWSFGVTVEAAADDLPLRMAVSLIKRNRKRSLANAV